MDNTPDLIIGGIYKTNFNSDLRRVIAFDEFEVFYDAYWTTLDKWTFSDSLNGKCFYYRTTPYHFLNSAELLKVQPLTEKEFSIFRPDLAFRPFRHKQIQWTTEIFDSMDLYLDKLSRSGFHISDEIALNIPEIILHPYGPKGGGAKAKKISATNGYSFTHNELLWNAHCIQAINLREDSKDGVGLFRLGHEKKSPSYYIGNYYDKANFLRE